MERYGYTPFAKEHLLYPNGTPKDFKKRVFTFGGTTADGKRIREQMRGTVFASHQHFLSRDELTHLWVMWKDGRRHLVFRKIPFTNDHRPFKATSMVDIIAASGHWRRYGHKLEGYYMPTVNEPGTVRMVRTCCEEKE